jgi:ribosome recycling factor
MNKYVESRKAEFAGVIDFFKKDISSLRTGRANPSLLDGVFIEAYGAKTPINGVAAINVADSRSITVAPWDRSVLKDIEKGLVEADLGVGIVNEGDKIRLTMPMMTEENRRDLVKKLNEKMEKARISVRQVREDVKTAIEGAFEEKEIAEDDKFKFIKDLDEEVRKKNEELKEIRDKKEGDIMTI